MSDIFQCNHTGNKKSKSNLCLLDVEWWKPSGGIIWKAENFNDAMEKTENIYNHGV